MIRKQHPKKEVEEAIQYAEAMGWRYKAAGGSAHAWGRLLCPLQSRAGCRLSVWSTPKNAAAHARQIVRAVNLCPHGDEEGA